MSCWQQPSASDARGEITGAERCCTRRPSAETAKAAELARSPTSLYGQGTVFPLPSGSAQRASGLSSSTEVPQVVMSIWRLLSALPLNAVVRCVGKRQRRPVVLSAYSSPFALALAPTPTQPVPGVTPLQLR